MSLTGPALAFWNGYLKGSEKSETLKHAKVSASQPGDFRNCDALLQLYLEGKKTAGSGLVRDYEQAGDPLPEVGAYWILLDSRNIPQCIVRCVRVEIHAFSHVPVSVAEAEGEGDLSLAYWREAHARFFAPYLPRLGIGDLAKELIVTEFFEVVFRR